MKIINQTIEYILRMVASHTCTFVSMGGLHKQQTQLLNINC